MTLRLRIVFLFPFTDEVPGLVQGWTLYRHRRGWWGGSQEEELVGLEPTANARGWGWRGAGAQHTLSGTHQLQGPVKHCGA